VVLWIIPYIVVCPKPKNCRFIEIIKAFEIFGIIAGIKRIYAIYPTFGFVVKPKALIMRLQSNKKGESACWDKPF
jgi:hypothetical protein